MPALRCTHGRSLRPNETGRDYERFCTLWTSPAAGGGFHDQYAAHELEHRTKQQRTQGVRTQRMRQMARDYADDDLAWEEFYESDEDDGAEADPLAQFLDDGLITEVIRAVKSGKEGTVCCCRAAPALGVELVAAKVYRSRQQRSFRNDAVYQEGRVIGKHREARAVKNKTRVGRELQYSL